MSRALSDYLGRGIVPVSQITLTETTVITPDSDFMAVTVLIGAGGSGGFATGGDTGTNGTHRLHAQGGNAGGVCMQVTRYLAGESYTFTIPDVTAGVGRGTGASSALVISGSTGGNTTLASTAPGFSTITAYGGLGGVAWKALASSGADSTDHAHQTQTWGANADLIFSGGYGGAITVSVNHSNNTERALATGGGAVNLGSLPQDMLSGGDIDLAHIGSRLVAATGGGGVMGHGGNITHSGSGLARMATGGGSPSGAGGDLSESGASDYTSTGGIALPFAPNTLFPVDGAGGDGGNTSTPDNGGDGAGGGGLAPTGPANYFGANGGKFAGGAAVADGFTGTGYGQAGDGQFGGGGGGIATNHSASNNTRGYSGDGGQGVAFIFLLSDFGRVLA